MCLIVFDMAQGCSRCGPKVQYTMQLQLRFDRAAFGALWLVVHAATAREISYIHTYSQTHNVSCCRHEIVGIVTAVGPKVNKFKVGDRAGVGCLVDSCTECHQCTTEGEEQFCEKAVQTYNMKGYDGAWTHGGYSTHVVVVDR